MTDTVFKASDPISHKANNVCSLDKRIVQANDTTKFEEINKSWVTNNN